MLSPQSLILSIFFRHVTQETRPGWKNLRPLREKVESGSFSVCARDREETRPAWGAPRALCLFLGARETQKEPLLKEHSVFPPLLTSPGPMPLIIGKQSLVFLGPEPMLGECSDNTCCWLTVDRQCSRVRFFSAPGVKLRTALNNFNSLRPVQVEFTTRSLCGSQGGGQARWYLGSLPAPSLKDSIKKKTQIWKQFSSEHWGGAIIHTEKQALVQR